MHKRSNSALSHTHTLSLSLQECEMLPGALNHSSPIYQKSHKIMIATDCCMPLQKLEAWKELFGQSASSLVLALCDCVFLCMHHFSQREKKQPTGFLHRHFMQILLSCLTLAVEERNLMMLQGSLLRCRLMLRQPKSMRVRNLSNILHILSTKIIALKECMSERIEFAHILIGTLAPCRVLFTGMPCRFPSFSQTHTCCQIKRPKCWKRLDWENL